MNMLVGIFMIFAQDGSISAGKAEHLGMFPPTDCRAAATLLNRGQRQKKSPGEGRQYFWCVEMPES